MARIEDIERRLQNWARWTHGMRSGGLGFGGSSMLGAGSGSGYREAIIPTVDCEASETDMAVKNLETRLRVTVQQVYLTGASPSIDATVLGCSVSAVKARVWEAHRDIEDWLSERRLAAVTERERLERLRREAAR